MDRLTLIAHRGESEDFPENTLESFEAAVRNGAGLVECDVHLTRDREVVVIHDPTLDRTTDGSGEVVNSTWPELRERSAGYPERFGGRFTASRIPSLAEVLELMKGRAQVLIEIKPEAVGEGNPSPLIEELLRRIVKAGAAAQVALISFHGGALKQCKGLNPGIRTGMLFHAWPKKPPQDIVNGVSADFVIFNKALVVPEAREKVNAVRFSKGVYTVNDPAETGPLFDLGVRAMATDRFGAMTKALQGAGWGDRLDLSGAAFVA